MKSFFARYRAYLADNPNRYWFKRKVFGWGWTPATWEGWVTMAVFVALLILNAVRVGALTHSGADVVLPFVLQTFGMAAVLIGVAYGTGEKPKWQWGLGNADTKE